MHIAAVFVGLKMTFSALKRVDFPTFGKPTIPALSAIILFFNSGFFDCRGLKVAGFEFVNPKQLTRNPKLF